MNKSEAGIENANKDLVQPTEPQIPAALSELTSLVSEMEDLTEHLRNINDRFTFDPETSNPPEQKEPMPAIEDNIMGDMHRLIKRVNKLHINLKHQVRRFDQLA